MRPGRRFTLTELLAVFAVLLVFSAVAAPALWAAMRRNRYAACVANVHRLGYAVSICRQDNDDRWNLSGCTGAHHACQLLEIALGEGYVEDPQTLRCPNLNTPHPREPHVFPTTPHTNDWSAGRCYRPYPDGDPAPWWGVREIAYFLDEFRIPQGPPPGRAILADGIEMCTDFGPEPANHPDGSNVLFADLAVLWSPKLRPAERWLKREGQYAVGGGEGCHGAYATRGPWIRYGYIPNPRMSEDGAPDDLDDVYECEGEHGDPDKPDAFYSYALAARCDTPRGFGQPSRADCAVAGGACMEFWDSWRGGRREHRPTTTWYLTEEGKGHDGVTWGHPEGAIYHANRSPKVDGDVPAPGKYTRSKDVGGFIPSERWKEYRERTEKRMRDR